MKLTLVITVLLEGLAGMAMFAVPAPPPIDIDIANSESVAVEGP